MKMPPLTLAGKRLLIKSAEKHMGKKQLLRWLQLRAIPSIDYLDEHIRKYKAKFFRELYHVIDSTDAKK